MSAGTILYTTTDRIAVASPPDRDRELEVAPEALVTLNGYMVTLADLMAGDKVKYRSVVVVIEATR